MLIADSQVHIWERDDPESRPRHGDRTFVVADLLAEMKAANVQRAVLVPPYWEGLDNSVALAAAQRYPDRFRVMGRFDLDCRDPAVVQTWRQQPGMAGVRLTLHNPESGPYIRGDAADWFWAAAERCGLPVMLHVPALLPCVDRIARDFPRLKLAIDHMGIERGAKDDAACAHLDDLLALAKHPNVAVKLSTVPVYSSEPYPHTRLHPFIKAVCQAFGARRLFWGSDLSRLPCSYRVAVNLFIDEFSWLSADDLNWVMGRALCEWLDWPID